MPVAICNWRSVFSTPAKVKGADKAGGSNQSSRLEIIKYNEPPIKAALTLPLNCAFKFNKRRISPEDKR